MLERYEEVAQLAKELAGAERKVRKLSDAAGSLTMEDSTPRQRAAARSSLDSACEERDRAKHRLHVAVVRAYIAAPFEPSYYGEFRGGTPDYPMMIIREKP